MLHKKLYMLLAILGVVVFSCDPLDETYDELDAAAVEEGTDGESADFTLVLGEDEYEILETLEDNQDAQDAASFGNFNSEDVAKELVPVILTDLYPHLGRGSSALVTYDVYSPTRINNEVSFELTEQDYEDLGETFGNLSSESDILNAAEFKYPNAEHEDVITLDYLWWNGSEVVSDQAKVVFYEGVYLNAYVPTDDDYTFMGQSFPNFSSRSTGRASIGVLFNDLYKFDDEGTVRTSVWTYTFTDDTDGDGEDERFFVDFLTAYIFDGTVWVPQEDAIPQTLSFGHDGTTWVPDNTIKYTVLSDDWTWIGESWAERNADGSASVLRFGNFDVGLWSDQQRFDAIGELLLHLYPDTAEGQKYLVTYATWEPGAGTRTLNVIFEGGVFVEL